MIKHTVSSDIGTREDYIRTKYMYLRHSAYELGILRQQRRGFV